MSNIRPPINGQRRRGVAMAAVVICLMVIGLMAAGLVQRLVLQQRQTRQQQQRLQAFWLAESAVVRAERTLRRDPEFGGDRWVVVLDVEEEGTDDASRRGVAETTIAKVPSDPQARRIVVTAWWPDDPIHRGQHQRELTLSLSNQGASP